MRVHSGIVDGDAPVSYWPFFFSLSPVTVPEVFAKVNQAQFSTFLTVMSLESHIFDTFLSFVVS